MKKKKKKHPEPFTVSDNQLNHYHVDVRFTLSAFKVKREVLRGGFIGHVLR